MKKFFLGVFAIAGLVACVQTEEVDIPNLADNQIAFGGYVGNSVRTAVDPSTTVGGLNHFTVWAYVGDSQGEVFNSTLVSKDGNNAWTYDDARYWMDGHDYRFFAITPYGNGVGNVEVVNNPMKAEHDPFNNGLGQINFTNENGTEDVLYASSNESTKISVPEKVTFNFNHILSKIKFTFTNDHDGGVQLVIKDIKMTVPKNGHVALNEANLIGTPAADRVKYSWELDGTETLDLEFGAVEGGAKLNDGETAEADKELFTIPALDTQEYKISFTVEVWDGNACTPKTLESTLSGKEFVSGTAYNLTATITPETLDAKKIEFDAIIVDWVQDGDTNLYQYEVAHALANGGNVKLIQDLNIRETIVIPAGVTSTLDLNGKTISGSIHKSIGAIIKNEGTLEIIGGTISSLAENGGSAIANSGNLTVKDATLNGAVNANGSWPSYTVNNTGVLTLENTTITSYHGAVASYEANALVTLNDCTIEMQGIPGFTSHGMYTYNSGAMVVNGGNYTNFATDQGSTGASVINGAVTVNSGNFNGRVENYYGTPVLNGGSYSVKPNANFVSAGNQLVAGDYRYYVLPTTTYEAVAEGLLKTDAANYTVASGAGLANLNSLFANKTAGKGVVVNLLADINFAGKTWATVDSHVDAGCYISEFNGNGHTINNLTINGQAMFSRFASTKNVVIKDVTFDNANVNSNGSINTSILTVQSYDNLLLDNVDVKNSTIVGGYKVAALVATVYNEGPSTITATLKNCDVENTTVKATSYDFCTAGLVAFVYGDDNDKVAFENCSVSDVKLYAPNVYTLHAAVCAIYENSDYTLLNEAEGVTVTNVTFENI